MRIMSWMRVQKLFLVDIREFEHKAIAAAAASLPGADSPIRAIGNRRIINDGAAVSIAGEAEIRRLIGSDEVKRCVVGPIAYRERIGCRIIALGERTRMITDTLQIDLVRTGQRSVSGKSGNDAIEA